VLSKKGGAPVLFAATVKTCERGRAGNEGKGSRNPTRASVALSDIKGVRWMAQNDGARNRATPRT
jgi:hypothetical protein